MLHFCAAQTESILFCSPVFRLCWDLEGECLTCISVWMRKYLGLEWFCGFTKSWWHLALWGFQFQFHRIWQGGQGAWVLFSSFGAISPSGGCWLSRQVPFIKQFQPTGICLLEYLSRKVFQLAIHAGWDKNLNLGWWNMDLAILSPIFLPSSAFEHAVFSSKTFMPTVSVLTCCCFPSYVSFCLPCADLIGFSCGEHFFTALQKILNYFLGVLLQTDRAVGHCQLATASQLGRAWSKENA